MSIVTMSIGGFMAAFHPNRLLGGAQKAVFHYHVQ